MLLFNSVNLLESIQQYAGPNWNLFVYAGTPPSDLDSVPFDIDNEELLVQNSVSVIRLTSSILTNPYALDFIANARMLGNWHGSHTWEQSQPKVGNNPIYRVGVKSVETLIPNVSFGNKLDMMCGRAPTILNVASPNNYLLFNLSTLADLSHISVDAGAGTSYTVFATGSGGRVELFSATGPTVRRSVIVLDATQIEIVIANNAAASLSSVVGYTQESLVLQAPAIPTWAVLKPVTYNANYLPVDSKLPVFVLSAGGPSSSAAVKLNKSSIESGDLASSMYLRVKPDTLEI